MRAVIQRVDCASVSVESREVGRIGRGLLVYLGIGKDDTTKDAEYLADKTAGLRIFPDHKNSMNVSAVEAGAQALVISQFTLLGDVRRGKRPSFTDAMAPEGASALCDEYIALLRQNGVPSATGEFRAMMKIDSVNDGPVTILLDSKKVF